VRLLPQAGLRLTGRSRTTTFVAGLASIRILSATQSAEDLIRGSLILSPDGVTRDHARTDFDRVATKNNFFHLLLDTSFWRLL